MIRYRRSPERQLYWIGVSPLVVYAASFSLALLCYKLQWSGLYPPLSWQLIGFVGATALVCLLLAATQAVVGPLHVRQRLPAATRWSVKRARRAALLLLALTGLEFLHSGGIPLGLLFAESSYDYREFGIPVLHVAVFAAYTFLAVHWFLLYSESGNRRYLVYSLSMLAIHVLIVNRGALIQSVIAIGLVYSCRRGIRLRTATTVATAAVVLLVLFGVIGDARLAAEGADPKEALREIGYVSPDYPEALGSGPLWAYLYLSSPIANWQLNIDHGGRARADWGTYAALEALPDFVGKRLVAEDVYTTSPYLVTEALNASSAYGRAYYLLQWGGAVVIFLQFLGTYLLCRWLFRGTEYYASALAIFAAGSALLVFHNMLTFSGLIGPLLFAALLRCISARRRPRARYVRPAQRAVGPR